MDYIARSKSWVVKARQAIVEAIVNHKKFVIVTAENNVLELEAKEAEFIANESSKRMSSMGGQLDKGSAGGATGRTPTGVARVIKRYSAYSAWPCLLYTSPSPRDS